jgi:hypothetical protein
MFPAASLPGTSMADDVALFTLTGFSGHDTVSIS